MAGVVLFAVATTMRESKTQGGAGATATTPAVTDLGAEVLHAGDCAGFRGGEIDGHRLQNRGTADATVLENGSRIPGESAVYPDIDMKAESGVGYLHKDGTPYSKMALRGPG